MFSYSLLMVFYFIFFFFFFFFWFVCRNLILNEVSVVCLLLLFFLLFLIYFYYILFCCVSSFLLILFLSLPSFSFVFYIWVRKKRPISNYFLFLLSIIIIDICGVCCGLCFLRICNWNSATRGKIN